MDKTSKKIYVCDRCVRCDFINGHALGGHKKYCGKPEYKHIKKMKIQKDNIKKNKKKRDENQLKSQKINELIDFGDFHVSETFSEYLFTDNIDENIFNNLSFPFNYDQNIENSENDLDLYNFFT